MRKNLTMKISVSALKVASIHQEIFRFHKRNRLSLYEEIKTSGFNSDCPLKVRKIKRKNSYEVLCGVGRLEALNKLVKESPFSQSIQLQVDCEEVNLDNRGAAEMFLYENINAPRSYTGLSEFQMYFLVRIYNRISDKKISKHRLKELLGIRETLYQFLGASVKYSIDKLKRMYGEFFADATGKFKDDPLHKHLIDLKLVNHALAKNEWNEFGDFFHGEVATSAFHSQFCEKSGTGKNDAEKNKDLLNKINKIFQGMKSVSEEIKDLTVEQRHLLTKQNEKTWQHFIKLLKPEKQNKKQSSPAKKAGDEDKRTTDPLFPRPE